MNTTQQLTKESQEFLDNLITGIGPRVNARA